MTEIPFQHINKNAIVVSLSFAVLIALAPVAASFGDDPTDASQRQELLNRWYLAQANQYEFAEAANAGERFKLRRESLMNWAVAGEHSGSVFIWTVDGKPRLIGCIGAAPTADGRMDPFHEFHSLSSEPLTKVEITGVRNWTWSPKAGVEFAAAPKTPAPARSAAGRLIQMRRLARKFTVGMTAEDEPWELRMLPQPLYRYPSREDGVDGAVFAWLWTKGTDPEFLMVVETLETKDGLRWQYAPARFTWRPLRLEHGGKEVWRVDEYKEQWKTTNLKEPYATLPVQKVAMDGVEQVVKEGSK